MPESSWPENDSYSELEPLSALLAELSPLVEEPEATPFHRRDRRRKKAAIVFASIWGGTIALHICSFGSTLVWGLTALLSIHAVRLLTARPQSVLGTEAIAPPEYQSASLLPFVSLLVSAKNEEAVIGRLVDGLCRVDYPTDRYELWVIDDNSSDRTPEVLATLAKRYSQLRIFRRLPGSTGGKSGALNQVLPLTRGDILAVFDADAQVPTDLLRRVVPLFERSRLGAVQVRKSVSNWSNNLWIRGQVAEMAFDTFLQQRRIAIGGIGELRGNGQFVRRAALDHCGGWNEETITDDLDLTIRLHLDQWDIDATLVPAVEEEGVTTALSLWHQRNRWAEGGYQRYLDYWRPIVRNKMGTQKTTDLLIFVLMQYLLPVAMVPDALMALIRMEPMVLAPLSVLSVSLPVIGIALGLWQIQRSSASHPRFSLVEILVQTGLGVVYLFHWIPIIASMSARISVRPKQLKWVKTVHQGQEFEGGKTVSF